MRHSIPLLLCGVLALGLQACDQNGKVHGMRGAGGGGGGHGLRKECRAELQQYCADAGKGRARRQCLEGHRAQLSTGCATALDARKGGGGGRKRNKDNAGTGNDQDD